MAQEYVLDGTKITSLEAFYDEFGEVLALDEGWGRNLDALDDVLSGGDLGIPEEGFVLTWLHSDVSREQLGYPETVTHLEKRLQLCHPENREVVRAELNDAKQGRGRTVFDWLIDVIREHGDNVRLVLR